jgi:hypothetical protein
MFMNNRGMSFLAVTAVAAAGLLAPPTAVGAGAGSFSPTGSLPFPRSGAMAAPLLGGRVLVAGGQAELFGLTARLSSALVFNPGTNSFSSAGVGSMSTARAFGAAAPLPDGRVLVAGGEDSNGDELASAEIFDPASNAFSPTGSMGTTRTFFAAAPLPGGMVLVAGGLGGGSTGSAEVFDPATNSFSPVGSLAVPRMGAAAAPLPDGRVLVAGGRATGDPTLFSSAEVFDPATNSFSSAGIGALGTARGGPAGAPLPDGRVLVAGGGNADQGTFFSTAEVFDPATNTFSSAGIGSISVARFHAAAARLGDGRVLLAGGHTYKSGVIDYFATAEIFAASNAFSYRVRGKRLLVTVQASGTAEVKAPQGRKAATAAKRGKRRKGQGLKPSSASGGPGTIAVPLRLSKAAKGKLRRKGKVRVRAAITFSPQGGLASSRAAKLKIKAKKKRKGKGR